MGRKRHRGGAGPAHDVDLAARVDDDVLCCIRSRRVDGGDAAGAESIHERPGGGAHLGDIERDVFRIGDHDVCRIARAPGQRAALDFSGEGNVRDTCDAKGRVRGAGGSEVTVERRVVRRAPLAMSVEHDVIRGRDEDAGAVAPARLVADGDPGDALQAALIRRVEVSVREKPNRDGGHIELVIVRDVLVGA